MLCSLVADAPPTNGSICVCKENYVGDRCQFCGAGYYGEPETPGKFTVSLVCGERNSDFDGIDFITVNVAELHICG